MEDNSILVPRRNHRQCHSSLCATLHGPTHQRQHHPGQSIASVDDLSSHRGRRFDRSGDTFHPGQSRCKLTTNPRTSYSLGIAQRTGAGTKAFHRLSHLHPLMGCEKFFWNTELGVLPAGVLGFPAYVFGLGGCCDEFFLFLEEAQ